MEWLRHINRPDDIDSKNVMIENWPLLGMISLEPGPDDAVAPAFLKVETEVGFTEDDVVFDAAPALSRISRFRRR